MLLASTKIIGTAATGLWASYNIAVCHNYAEIPAIAKIFGVDSVADLKSTVSNSSALSVLSGVGSVSLLVSYVFSPRNGKHPYLLYGALGGALIGILQFCGAQDLKAQLPAPHEPERSELTGSVYEKIGEDKETDSLPLANKAKLYTRVVAVLSTGLYFVGLVGLAGDSL